MGETHGGEGEGVPFKESCGWHVDKDVLTSISKEPLAPHLDLDGLGGMLHHLDDDNLPQTTEETDRTLYGVDDESTQHVGPCLCVCELGGVVKK